MLMPHMFERITSSFRGNVVIIVLLTFVALASRIPLMSISLGEVDAGNFCNALLHGFDINEFRPHAPGYPIYVFLTWVVNKILSDCIVSQTLVSSFLGSLVIIPFYLLVKDMTGSMAAIFTSLLLIANPLHWSFSEAALSDVPSTFFVVLAGYLAYRGRRSDWSFFASCAMMCVAIGVRPANVCLLSLVAFPVIYRTVVEHRFPMRTALVGALVFACVLSIWLVPSIHLGSGGIEAFWSALHKQWVNAVTVGDVSRLESPWLVSFFYRTERFALGYLLLYSWTATDAKTLGSLLYVTPWIIGLLAFIWQFSLKNPRHMFLGLWLIAICYPIWSIHFLPRYGLPYMPAFLIASLLGWQYVFLRISIHRRRFEVFSIFALASVLVLYLVKLQPPVNSFEVNPPQVQSYVGLIGCLSVLLIIWLVVRDRPTDSLISIKHLTSMGRRQTLTVYLVCAALTVFLIPYAILGYKNASIAHRNMSPAHQLVTDVSDTYLPKQTRICWDNQTHSLFESMAPQFVLQGQRSSEELYSSYKSNRVLIMTDRCRWLEEMAETLDARYIGSYSGESPIWAKAPLLQVYEIMPGQILPGQ
jgi:4-amino-4-deoxy-L-arabinose transferase-like glycosyltransferase